MSGQQHQGPKRFASRLRGAERAKRAAELYVMGWTWERIAKEVGYSHRATAMTAAKKYRDEIPAEAVEELRRTLIERSERNYAKAIESFDKLRGEKVIDAAAKVARILKVHGELGGVIRQAPPAIVTVTNTNVGIDTSKLAPEKLATLHALVSEATQLPTSNLVEKPDTIAKP